LLRTTDYKGDPAVMDFRLKVHGELIGVPDADLFWRLPNRAPNFQPGLRRVIALADSVTVMEEGRGWPDRLPANLLEGGFRKPVQVFNAGVPGYTSLQGLRYLERDLLDWDPELVAIQFGWNDHWPARGNVADADVTLPGPRVLALQKALGRVRLYRLLRTAIVPPAPPPGTEPRVSPAQYGANLRRIVERVRAQQGRVILFTAPYLDGPWEWKETHRRYNAVVRELATELDAPLVDPVADFLDRPDLFFWPKTDAAHFNGQGAVLIARQVAQTIVERNLLP